MAIKEGTGGTVNRGEKNFERTAQCQWGAEVMLEFLKIHDIKYIFLLFKYYYTKIVNSIS